MGGVSWEGGLCVKFECFVSPRGGLGGAVSSREGLGGQWVRRESVGVVLLHCAGGFMLSSIMRGTRAHRE